MRPNHALPSGRTSRLAAATRRPALLLATLCLNLLMLNGLAFAGKSQKAASPPMRKTAGGVAAQPHSSGQTTQTSTDDPAPAKVLRYARRLIRQYDQNGDGVLDPAEWRAMGGKLQDADANRDEVITVEEMAQRIVAYGRHRRIHLAAPPIGVGSESSPDDEAGAPGGVAPGKAKAPAEPPAPDQPEAAFDMEELEERRTARLFYVPPKRLPQGLPHWFLDRDEDGDGQLSPSEFAPTPSTADVQEFRRYDRDGDGLITAKECLGAVKSPVKPSPKKAANR